MLISFEKQSTLVAVYSSGHVVILTIGLSRSLTASSLSNI
jgi:hypothetical protein